MEQRPYISVRHESKAYTKLYKSEIRRVLRELCRRPDEREPNTLWTTHDLYKTVFGRAMKNAWCRTLTSVFKRDSRPLFAYPNAPKSKRSNDLVFHVERHSVGGPIVTCACTANQNGGKIIATRHVPCGIKSVVALYSIGQFT